MKDEGKEQKYLGRAIRQFFFFDVMPISERRGEGRRIRKNLRLQFKSKKVLVRVKANS